MPLYANAGRLQALYRYKGHQEVELYKSPGAIDAPDAKDANVSCIPSTRFFRSLPVMAIAWIYRPATRASAAMATSHHGDRLISANTISSSASGTYSAKFPWARMAASRSACWLWLRLVLKRQCV